MSWTSPFSLPGHWYKGNLHTHTTQSDGDATPEQAVAWYGDRDCVWTPPDTSRSFYSIYDEQKTVSGLYLTPLTTDARFLTQILQGPDWEWSRFAADVLLRTNLPSRFPLQHARKRYTPDQLFLSDRPRWQR